MRFRHSASIVAAGAMAAAVLAASPAAGQGARTAWGDPDLQGLWNIGYRPDCRGPAGRVVELGWSARSLTRTC